MMTEGVRTVLAVGVMLGVSAWLASCSARGGVQGPVSTAAQAPSCLHGADEDGAERTRRFGALRLTRAINTAQVQQLRANGRFGALDALQGLPEAPDGFDVQLASDERGYVFAVKDTLDPCGFVYFSDQNGLIYTGEPIR